MGTTWFSEHLFTENNGTLSRDSSHVCEPTNFWSSVRGKFEKKKVYTELRKTVTNAGRRKRLIGKDHKQAEGAVSVDRCEEDRVMPVS